MYQQLVQVTINPADFSKTWYENDVNQAHLTSHTKVAGWNPAGYFDRNKLNLLLPDVILLEIYEAVTESSLVS